MHVPHHLRVRTHSSCLYVQAGLPAAGLHTYLDWQVLLCAGGRLAIGAASPYCAAWLISRASHVVRRY